MLSSYLAFVGHIHIASHVDIDGMRQESNHRPNDSYIQTVVNARLVVRALECAMQATFDAGASLLVTLQSWRSNETPTHILTDNVDPLLATINDNLTYIQQSLDSLLSIGREQADVGQNDYRESIRRRLQRLSQIGEQFGGTARPISPLEDNAPEDVVDMNYAFSKPSGSKGPGSSDQYEPAHRSYPSISRQSVSTELTVIGDDDESTYPHDDPNAFDDDSER